MDWLQFSILFVACTGILMVSLVSGAVGNMDNHWGDRLGNFVIPSCYLFAAAFMNLMISVVWIAYG